MSRAIGNLVLLLLAVAIGFLLHRVIFPPNPWGISGNVTHASQTAGPTIEQVQKLANLVALRVPISDVQTSRLDKGFTGGIEVALAVHGEVEIATDLSKARVEALDGEKKTAVIVLPAPALQRPRLDHEKTRVLEFRRTGLWSFVLGQAGEEKLTTEAMARAQEVLAQAAQKPELIEQAREHTATILREFFRATGWDVAVRWEAPAKNQ